MLLLRLRALAVVAVLAVVAAGCGGDGDADADRGEVRDGDAAAQGQDDDEDAGDAADSEDPTGGAEEDALPPVQVTAPPAFSSVHRSFVLRGTAQVFEGELRWSIVDAEQEPLASGRMMASCGAPCRGTFSTRVDVSKVPVGSWELHVFAPPVSEGDPPRMHDVMLPITVVGRPVDQPPADAPPPGGVPNDL